MRIGIEGTSLYGRRGPTRYTFEILKAIVPYIREEDQFLIYCPYSIPIDLPKKYLVRHLPFQKPLPWMNFTLAQQAIKDGIDLMFFPANAFWLLPFTKTVITVHDLAPAMELYKYHANILDRLEARLQLKRLNKIATRLITGSKYTAKKISDLGRVNPSLIEIIPNGVRRDVFYTMAKKQEGDYILYVGGFDRRKNLDRLLKAHALIVSMGYRNKLVFAGNTGLNKKLYYDMKPLISNNRLEERVEVILSPSDDDLRRLYNEARVCVLPSIIEGFGLPVLEAMACGCPVASSNAASLPEVGGDAAIYFDPYDVNDMAEKIMILLKDKKLRNEMVSRGLKQAAKFNWDEAGRKVYQILKEVYEGKK